jgi:hypothetical protein
MPQLQANAPATPAAPTAGPVPGFDDLIDIATRLTPVMQRENDCLAKFDLKGLSTLHEEKLQLTRVYCQRVYDLKKDPTRLSALALAVRDELKSVLGRFDEVAKANERILRSTREANDRVLKVVIEAANKVSEQVPSYSRNGAMARPYGSLRAPVTPPVSINRCF